MYLEIIFDLTGNIFQIIETDILEIIIWFH
jgi:hypothetical protein